MILGLGLALLVSQTTPTIFPPSEFYDSDRYSQREFLCVVARRMERAGIRTDFSHDERWSELIGTGTGAAVLCTDREVELWDDARFLRKEMVTLENRVGELSLTTDPLTELPGINIETPPLLDVGFWVGLGVGVLAGGAAVAGIAALLNQ